MRFLVSSAAMEAPDLDAARAAQGPLTAAIARGLLDRARDHLESGEPADALADYRRVFGFDDAAMTAEAWLGAGDALFRLDHEPEALSAWETAVKLPETPSTYGAWRQIAGARVRSGDLPAARDAYREADRRAPAEDKAYIAGRLGWLSKEMGQSGAAGRYFARSRGTGYPIGLTQVILGVTVLVSLIAMFDPSQGVLQALALDKGRLAAGELYRLWSVTLVHDPSNILHLGFNMYALYLLGPIVESIWGSRLFLLFYLLTGAAASTLSFVSGPETAVGASGAIFGLVGVLLAGSRAHHPVLDQRARAIVPQLVPIILINLAIGFFSGGTIDNSAHIGGLISGMWLGLVVPPGKVPTLRSMWTSPTGQAAMRSPLLIAAGILLLVAAIAAGLAIGGVRI
jgi:membrane associated rhomboid family serine protease